jgi:prevent-host-death family protein
MQVNIYQAKTHLSDLVEQANQGQTIVIAKNGTPLAKLVPLQAQAKPKIIFGLMRGEFKEADDFDAPLPEDTLALFEGRLPGEPPRSVGGRRNRREPGGARAQFVAGFEAPTGR